jgi:hypothetical protein
MKSKIRINDDNNFRKYNARRVVFDTSLQGANIMRYTFLLYSDPSAAANMAPDDWEREKAVYGAYIGALKEAGVFVDTDWLQPVETATTISMAGGQRQVQDGPFAATRETLGGYFVVNVPNLDAALMWAAKCPAAQYGKVEVRPSAMGG